MPPPEFKEEQILAGLEAQLLARIQGGANYFHVLQVVGRPPSWVEFDAAHVPQDVTTFAMLRAGLSAVTEQPAQAYDGLMEAWLLAGTRHTPESYSPWLQPTPKTQTVQNRLIKDVVKAIMADVSIGGLAINAELKFIDRAQHLEGWVLAEFFLQVAYSSLAKEP